MEILIAEDDRSSRAFLMELLEATGNEPVPAEDGRQAWEILQNSNISMVVTDWMMPNMDGLELCRMIRDNDLSRYVYVVILTSKEGKDHCVEGLNAGADDYLEKPVNKEEQDILCRIILYAWLMISILPQYPSIPLYLWG